MEIPNVLEILDAVKSDVHAGSVMPDGRLLKDWTWGEVRRSANSPWPHEGQLLCTALLRLGDNAQPDGELIGDAFGKTRE